MAGRERGAELGQLVEKQVDWERTLLRGGWVGVLGNL